MKIKNKIQGLIAWFKLSKSSKSSFRQLPKHLKKSFFKLSAPEQDQFLLFVDILRQNSQKQVISSVRTIAKQSGAPAVELYEYLDLEAKKQHNFAQQKLENQASDPNIKTKGQTDIVTVSSAREMRERLSLLREQTHLDQNIKRRSRKR